MSPVVATLLGGDDPLHWSKRDWKIFLLSWLIGNAWWSVVCFTGISAVEWLWQAVKHVFQ